MEKTFKFDKAELKTVPEKNQFKAANRDKLLEEEQCLIDNLWNLSTTDNARFKKVTCINALVHYFLTGKHLKKKPFTCYSLFTGPSAGVYLTWEDITEQINELKKTPRYGQPLYKGFYCIEEAITSAERLCGKDIIIEPKVLKYQEYLKHIEQFGDQEFLKDIGTSTSSTTTTTQLRLAPQTTKSEKNKTLSTFSDIISKTPSKEKEREYTVLGKPCTPNIPTRTQIPNTLVSPRDCTIQTFLLLQECLTQLANNQISHKGISTSWEFTYNPFKICQFKFPDCPESQDKQCLCKLDSAIRKANILIPGFYSFKFRDYPITIPTFIKHGLVNTLNLAPLHEFSSILPPQLAETLETIVPDFPREILVKFVSLYPDFEYKIPAFHMVDILFKGIDEEYSHFDGRHESPKLIKMEETMEQQIDLVRAKIIAQNYKWNMTDFSTKNILREDRHSKIYCDSSIASKFFFPFEVEHSKPRLVHSYRRHHESRLNPTTSSRPSSSGSSQG